MKLQLERAQQIGGVVDFSFEKGLARKPRTVPTALTVLSRIASVGTAGAVNSTSYRSHVYYFKHRVCNILIRSASLECLATHTQDVIGACPEWLLTVRIRYVGHVYTRRVYLWLVNSVQTGRRA